MKKIFSFILLSLCFLSYVSAADVDFTGTFSDSGRDTNADGKYNFLDISFNVNVNSENDYYFYGLLKNNNGDYIEARNEYDLGIGLFNIMLPFSGEEIYSYGENGPYILEYVEISKPNSPYPPIKVNSQYPIYPIGSYLYTDFDKPESSDIVYCLSSPCVASSLRLSSRDNIAGKSELNAPNTIDGCQDGDKGIYLSDESIENITITDIYGSDFRMGDKVKVEAVVYCWSAIDRLNFVYTNNTNFPRWKVMGYEFCGSSGFKILSKEFYLDNIEGNHTMRGVFQNSGSVTETCGQGDYDDNDDVTFLVKDATCYDGDGDGYGFPGSSLCAYPELDCDNSDASINPGKNEICWNDIDDNCNGLADYDDAACRQNSIQLKEGWNLISIAYELDNDSVETVMDSIDGNYKHIFSYENSEWKFFDPLNIENSNLDKIKPELGYWVEMTGDDTLFISGNKLGTVSYNLVDGWNLISYPSNITRNADIELAGAAGNFESVLGYDGTWLSYSGLKPHNNLVNLEFDSAIFVKVNDSMTWIYDDGYNVIDSELRYRIRLLEGWNMFSIPIALENRSIDNLLAPIVDCYDIVWTMEDGKWLSTKNKINPLVEIKPTNGYLIDMNASCSLDVNGYLINSTTLHLNDNVNLMGWPSYRSREINSLFDNATVWIIKNGNWVSNENQYNPLSMFEPIYGYYITLNSSINITITN